MNPIVLPTHTPALLKAAIEEAAQRLRAGEVVGVPTETVYGLAADALNPAAVARIFSVKGRPASNPLIVHVAGIGMARDCASTWPALAELLAREYWPGPLTLVVPRAARIPDGVTAGGPTVALRWPRHPFMQGLIRACGFPIAAPSANPSNALSPTSAAHVVAGLDGRIGLVVDGGDCNVGIESTVVDCTGPAPVVLRPGMISERAIRSRVAELDPSSPPESGPVAPFEVARSPGMLTRHYSPRARLVVAAWADEAALQRRAAALGFRDLSKVWVLAYDRVPSGGGFEHVVVIPEDPEAYARALYGELHRCDAAGAELILVEAVPKDPEWVAVADRIARAAGGAPVG